MSYKYFPMHTCIVCTLFEGERAGGIKSEKKILVILREMILIAKEFATLKGGSKLNELYHGQ